MTGAAHVAKGHRDENFPVASILIAPRHRPLVLAFYRVARMADDVADDAGASDAEKLGRLADIEASLVGAGERSPAAAALRGLLEARGLSVQPMLDLITAFRLDVAKRRYSDWADLMAYCRLSANPVGRFMLAVHGEAPDTWPASDALCSALQVINHLQDCAADYRTLDRVYLPLDGLAQAGLGVDCLGADRACPELRLVIADLAARTRDLLASSRDLASSVRDLRLSLEIGVIQTLAEDLAGRLARRDPLSERVRHSRGEAARLALIGVVRPLLKRSSFGRRPSSYSHSLQHPGARS